MKPIVIHQTRLKAYQKWYSISCAYRYNARRGFFRTESGNEPVREWLRGLRKTDKRVIGSDIKMVQYG